jgi:hypothetical protein
MPATRFETPETTGEQGRFEIAAAELHTGTNVDVMHDDIRSEPSIAVASIKTSKPHYGAGTRFGAFERLDFVFKYVSYSNPVLMAKWRVFGENRLPGEWLFTLTAGVGKGNLEHTFETIGLSNKISYIRNTVTKEFAPILGYRYDEKWIGYFSPYYMDAQIDFEWRFAFKTIVKDRIIKIGSKAVQYGAVTGAEYRFNYLPDKALRFIAEIGLSQTKYATLSKTGFYYGLGFNMDAPF